MVALRDVGRSFPGTSPVVAIHDIDLDIHLGDYLSIVGPSGSGKSTLLHIIGLLDQPTSGTYLLDGADTTVTSERAGQTPRHPDRLCLSGFSLAAVPNGARERGARRHVRRGAPPRQGGKGALDARPCGPGPPT